MDYWEKLNSIVNKSMNSGSFRTLMYNMIPASTEKILDFGYGDGALLLKLKRDKNCREIYGVEDTGLGEAFNNNFFYIISSDPLHPNIVRTLGKKYDLKGVSPSL